VTAYRIHTIRLINFHNFVEEAVDVREGGHLFLLGDNGAGKTTVLDAVHYVLSGGELEFNAAARVGGRRDEGRTIQGIVLRCDFERGVRNEGGAIAYAAVELVGDGGERLSLGVGTEATTMESKVTRWGFISRQPLGEIALLDGADQPLDREQLRGQLGAAAVFAQIGAYRKELARRLFGSERQYEEVVRFWGMAKAYREIVAGARDFGTLFERLLPTPDGVVFDEILRTLRAIDDLELALRDLDGQVGYVRDLAKLARDVAEHREAAARYRWLELVRQREEVLEARASELAAAAAGDELVARLEADAEAAHLAAARADENLHRAERDDAAGVLPAIRAGEQRRSELANDAERAALGVHGADRTRDAASRMLSERRRELATSAEAAAGGIARGIGEIGELPGELTALRELEGALAAIAAAATAPEAPLPALPAIEAANQCVDQVAAHARERLIATKISAASARARREAAGAQVAELEVTADPIAVPGLDRARRALAAAGIEARLLYELLEPARDAAPGELAAIEALAGPEALAALIVARSASESAQRVVAEVAPEVRVVVAQAPLELPAWCARALGDAPPEALAALAAILHQPRELGELAPPGPDGAVALRGLGFQVSAEAPRWLGSEARRRAREQQLAAARDALAAAVAVESDATRILHAAEALVGCAERLGRAVLLADGPLVGAWHAAAAAAQRHELAAQAAREAEGRHLEVATRLASVDDDLAALRARASGVDLEELERRLGALRAGRERAHERYRGALTARAEAAAKVEAARKRAAEAEAQAEDLSTRLGDALRLLRERLAATGSTLADASEEDLARSIRVTQRGDSFRSLNAIRQRLSEAEREADRSATELDNDGSRGVRSLTHAAKFGFTYDRDRNHIADRRGQPLAGVLADLERTIAEQRTVVNERTRTLMDTLFMGELARHLHGQVHGLKEMINGINRVLRGLRFGPAEYQFEIARRADRAELIDLVQRLSLLDEDSRTRFRTWMDAHLDDLRTTENDDGPPPLLDYRKWFEFKLRMTTTSAEGVELTQALRRVGSGGEQAVPNYLLVLALSKLMFDAAGAAIRPLMFDEAFYGIDAGRRDQLLRLATDLGLQLLVASPDQDGATNAVRLATTLFVVKDANHDIHLAPYHYWNHAQPRLFEPPQPEPDNAICKVME